jgi:ABC-2 type transport system permease protein
MTALIRAEVRKLATTRTCWLLAVGAFVLIVGGATATAIGTTFTGPTSPARATLALAGLAQTCALLVGTLAVTGEYRHKTITITILMTPRRTPVLVAKLIAVAIAGLIFGLLATGAAVAVTMPILSARHITSGISGAQLAGIIVGGGVGTALWAALGVGVGAIIRNQVGAVVAVLFLLYAAEPLIGFLPGVGTAVQEYGLAGLSAGVTGTASYPATAHLLGQAAAGAVLVAYAAVALLAGAVLLRQRDITA